LISSGSGREALVNAYRLLTALALIGVLSICWVAPSSNGGSPVTGYLVFRSTTPGTFASTPYATVSDTNLAYSDASVVLGTTYYYVIEAANAIGGSVAFKQVTATP
jgi:hypothetical protein